MIVAKCNEDGTLTISKEDFDSLMADSRLLNTLKAHGVDNWEGWEAAIEEEDEWTN